MNAFALSAGRRQPALPRHGRQQRISVIIPTFNRAELVVEALDSVAAQTWRAVEIIVVDDGSTDGTHRVVGRWHELHPAFDVTLLTQRNRGVSAARNAGAKRARGDFLFFLDSDDLILPDALSMLVAPLLAGSAPFSVAHIRSTDLNGRPTARFAEGLSHQVAGSCFKAGWMMHAALYRRSTFAAAGPFDETLPRGEDSEHQWRVLHCAGSGALIDAFIGVRRIHDHGHLCAFRSPETAIRDCIAALERFLDWAARNDRLESLDRRGLFLRAAALSVRAGNAGDWDGHAEALSLITRTNPGSRFRSLSTAILALRWRWLQVLLMSGLVTLKWLRNRSAAHRIAQMTWCVPNSAGRAAGGGGGIGPPRG